MTYEIRGGTEFFFAPNGECAASCARCGSSVYWDDCETCGGDGYVENDDFDDLNDWDRETYSCDGCNGQGGHWRCLAGWEWCIGNPLEGRAHIESTAIRVSASQQRERE